LAGFPKKNVDQYLSVLKKAGLSPIIFETESEAISSALIKNRSCCESFIVNFGDCEAIFMAYAAGFLLFSSVMSVRLPDITHQNYKCKPVPKMKIIKKSKESEKTSEALESFFQEVSGEIEKYINYYRTYISKEGIFMPNKNQAEKIILCGDSSGLEKLPAFLSSSLSMKAEWAESPNIIFPKSSKKITALSAQEKLAYIPAIGLAKRKYSEI
jgi:Tfp pilus assembly PilM family ATPase